VDVAALILWLITAGGGFYLLGTWLVKGGARPQPAGAGSRFPPAVIFGHFALAAAGLIVWIVYLVTVNNALAWTAFVIIAVVALLGFTMFARWIPTFRAQHGGSTLPVAAGTDGPAERHFPVVVVGGHGLLAAATLLLVLLTAIGVGGS